MNINLALTDDVIEQIAQRVAEVIGTQPEPLPEYLNVEEAATYLRCTRQRVYDLASARRIPKLKDGSRVLFARADLDAYLRRAA